MCYGGCRPTCDNCAPKFVRCPKCDFRNMLDFPKCVMCGELITDDLREKAIEQWHENRKASEEDAQE